MDLTDTTHSAHGGADPVTGAITQPHEAATEPAPTITPVRPEFLNPLDDQYALPALDAILHIVEPSGRVYGVTSVSGMSASAGRAQRRQDRIREVRSAARWFYARRRRAACMQRIKELKVRLAASKDYPTLRETWLTRRELKEARLTIKLQLKRYGLRRLKSICGMYCKGVCHESYIRGQLALVEFITAGNRKD